MIVIHATYEDLEIVAERQVSDWRVRVMDFHNEKAGVVRLTDMEIGAVMALATAGDEWDGNETVRDQLYTIATSALAPLERDIWPIP